MMPLFLEFASFGPDSDEALPFHSVASRTVKAPLILLS